MDSLPFNLEDIKLESNTFADVGICVSGTVDQKLIKLFESGGAKVRTYSGVLVSHFIAGSDADENKVEEAKDIFELPIVSPRWIAYSALLGKTLPTDGFKGETNQLFSKVTATTSGIVGEDLKIIWASLTYYGGSFSKHLTNRCTHLIINKTSGNKYHQAKEKGLKIVTCDWVTDCIKRDQIVDELIYDPTLLTEPKATKSNVGPPVQTTVASSNPDNQEPQSDQFTVNVNVNTLQIRPPQPKQATPISTTIKTVAGSAVMVRPVVPVHSQNILQTQLLLQNTQSKAGNNQQQMQSDIQQKQLQQQHIQQQFQQQQLQHQQQLLQSSQSPMGQQHIQLIQSSQAQPQKSMQQQPVPAQQQQLPQTTQSQQQLNQSQVQQHQIIQTSQGQLLQPSAAQQQLMQAIQAKQQQLQSQQQSQLIQTSQPQLIQTSQAQQQQKLMQGSQPQQQQQLIHGSKPQLMQNSQQQLLQGSQQQHLIQGSQNQQLMQNTQPQQLIQVSQAQQQLMQGSQSQQQQLIQNSQAQQLMQSGQQQQQLMQNQQQLMQNPQQQQLMQNTQQQPQLMQNTQQPSQLMQGSQQQPQIMQSPQPQRQQLMQSPQPQRQQLMQSPQPTNQQMMQSPQSTQQQLIQTSQQSQQQLMQSSQQTQQQQLMQSPQQSQQQLMQSPQQSQQQMMQSPQQSQQLMQSPQQSQQLMQSPQPPQQQLMPSPQQPQQRQLMQSPQPQQQLMQGPPSQQQQLMQGSQPQQQQRLMQSPQPQQFMQGSQVQQQLIQTSQAQQQLIQTSQSQQMIQTTQQQQLMHSSQISQQLISAPSQQLILQSSQQQQQGQLIQSSQQHQMLQSPQQQQQILQNSQQLQQIHSSQQQQPAQGQHLSQHQIPLQQSHQHGQFHMAQQPNRGQVMVSQVSQMNNFQGKTIQGQQMSQQMQQLLQQSSGGQNINVSIHQQNALRQQNPQQIHVSMSSVKPGQLIQALQHQQNQNQMNISQQQGSGNQIMGQQQVSQTQINIPQQQQVHLQQQTHTLNIQHINNSLPNQIPVQLQQGQQKQIPQNSGQISVQQQGFTGQQGSQYNVVMQQGQQYQKFGQSNNVPNQQMGQQTTTIQTGPNGQPIGVQKVQFQATGPPRLTTVQQHQWTPQQQLEIIRQIQMDPQIKQQWAQMDQSQRTLLIQKLAQRNREEHLRREMMLRQQQLNQHGAMQQPQQQKATIISQVGVPQQGTNAGQQHTVLGGQQQIINSQNQTIVVQSPQQSTVQTQQVISGQGQHVVSQSHQIINQNSTLSSQQMNTSTQQTQSLQLQQQQLIVQTNPNVQQINTPILNSGQSVLVQNHQIIGQGNQQKVLGQPMSQQTQLKFIPPSQVQQLGTRPQAQMIVTQQQQQGSGVVRTQQIFTPQVAQHPQQQQQRINVRHILVHQGQQPTRLPQQQIILQQGPPGSAQPQQKIAILQTHQQTTSTPTSQWVATPTGQPQRMGSPNQSTQVQIQHHRLPTPENQQQQQQQQTPPSPSQSPQQQQQQQQQQHPSPQWNVQVVHSKTKTALANLLSNRLQGANGPEPVATINTPTTTVVGSQTMCPPPPPAPPQAQPSISPQVTSPTAQHNIVIQRRTLSNLANGNKTVQVSNVAVGRVPATQQPSSPLTGSPVRTQHQYYGHDPSIKLPPDGFLLGCVFWRAESLDYEGWELAVMKYGGEVENEYGPRVTHVLSETQRFPEFQQSIREGKRLVTLNWLNDVCVRKVMSPPFYALHIPVAYSRNDQPLKGQLFCLTGFTGEDRKRAKKMCIAAGADCAPFFARNIQILLANKVDSILYQKAREYRKPVVNIQFLNEVLFGHTTCMQMIHSPKYQHFNLDQTFRFDVAMVPHLMAAWKTPVRVSNDIFEKFKNRKRSIESSDDTTVAKKPKTTENDLPPTPPLILKNVLDDDSPLTEGLKKHHVSVTCTGYTIQARTEIRRIMEKLPGARFTEDAKHANVLVLRLGMRTPKLFSCLSHVDVIVDYNWIIACCDAGRVLDPKEYAVEDPTFEKDFNTKFADILPKPNRHLLLSGIKFFITPGLKLTGLEDLIECAGGCIDSKQTSLKFAKELALKAPRRYIILSCVEDFRMLSMVFDANKPCPRVQTPDFILRSIAKQKVIRRLTSLIVPTEDGG